MALPPPWTSPAKEESRDRRTTQNGQPQRAKCGKAAMAANSAPEVGFLFYLSLFNIMFFILLIFGFYQINFIVVVFTFTFMSCG